MSDRSNLFGPGTSLVWNASLRSLHAALLLEGGVELAHEFWLGHPLETENGVLVGAELFEHVWQEKGLTPLDYQLRVLDSVEAFCLHRGIPFVDFVREKVLRSNGGSFLTPLAALAVTGKILLHLSRTRDLHWTLLETFDSVIGEMAPRVRTWPGGCGTEDGNRHGWLFQVHDTEYSGRHPGYDAGIWLGFQIRYSPERLGYPAFAAADCRCEVRDVSHILEAIPRGLHPSRGPDGWLLDGRPVTRTVGFHDWAGRQGILPSEWRDIPDHPVQEALVDIECPVRRRTVVRAGSAYGAKAYILRLGWTTGASFSLDQGLTRLIGDATGGKGLAEERHEELLRRFRQKLSFVYHRRDATISCNGEHLLRGVPAKILQKVLMAHTLTNRTQFEHREFRRDPDLGLDPLNPNLEGRLRILSDRLEERLQGIRLLKSTRGRFELEARTQVEFSED